MPHEVFEKWGFGMAPPKPAVQQERLTAASSVSAMLERNAELCNDLTVLENISVVKGLFNRVVREDQWD
jgi:hypothetical protein